MKPSGDCAADSLAERLAWAAYAIAGSVVAAAAVPVSTLPGRLARGLELRERLGAGWPPHRRCSGVPVWIHAASVGEVLSAAPLAGEFRRRRPGTPLLVSTTTRSGRDVARRELAPDHALLLPIDAPLVLRPVLRRLRPACLIVVETEIWPALFRCAAAAGVPVAVVSGRISARAFSRYRHARALIAPVLRRVAVFGMQTGEDRDRAVALGAPPRRVHVTGSLKAARQAAHGAPPPGLGGRPVLVAASTHPGEEDAVLGAAAKLWHEVPELLLVLAPRRPERFGEVAAALEERGLPFVRRTGIGADGVPPQARVLLLDTLGELAGFYPAARAVFVGGTLVPVGGHNVLEPAVFGKPVCFGPHTENVAGAASALVRAGAGWEVRDAAELGSAWRRLLLDPRAAEEAGLGAAAVARERAGALAAAWRLLEPILPRAQEPSGAGGVARNGPLLEKAANP